ncbi:MAG TPA: imidazole glycerol phosphate synthase subunit HisH [Anaerolineales bacterium]|nr:imidazole glycerol phosphate synthase subunit HisH [Anaerolineales bacterium]
MITIVDYKAGNLTSVRRALEALGLPCRITADPETVRKAERIIFPGVGHAGAAMSVLRERGLDSALKEAFERGTPILGICIGCQIVLSHSEEGDTTCLDLLPGECIRFQVDGRGLKVPHMGWNAVTVTQPHPVLAHLKPGDEFYFVHSYFPQPVDSASVYAACDYGGIFPAAIGQGNLFAVQFHAEKSGPVGLRLLKNFAEWTPC